MNLATKDVGTYLKCRVYIRLAEVSFLECRRKIFLAAAIELLTTTGTVNKRFSEFYAFENGFVDSIKKFFFCVYGTPNAILYVKG